MRKVKAKGSGVGGKAPRSSTRLKVARSVEAARPTHSSDDGLPVVTARDLFAGKLMMTSPSRCLERALAAKNPALRSQHALAGLQGPCDGETQALLLRQLYLGELEGGKLEHAREIAEQLVSLGTLGDVSHHDAARVCQALGDFDAAIGHLRQAASVGPPERRSFHLSTLGGLLYAIGRADEALIPLERALDMAGSAGPVLRGQLALVEHAMRHANVDLEAAYAALSVDASGQGYGRFVLGELAFARNDLAAARMHLESFLNRVGDARPAARAALGPEVAKATLTLAKLLN